MRWIGREIEMAKHRRRHLANCNPRKRQKAPERKIDLFWRRAPPNRRRQPTDGGRIDPVRPRNVSLGVTASEPVRASRRWNSSNFVGRPNFTPRALARSRPAPVRARMSSRSNSARPPRTVSISRPCGVVVSAQLSFKLLNPAPFAAISAKILSKSRVLRARRSSRLTTSTSPDSSLETALRSSGRSVRAPDSFSR